MIPTVTLNGVSVITIRKCSKLKEKISYFLLVFQSVTDLTVGLVNIPAMSIISLSTIATGSAHSRLAKSCYLSVVCFLVCFLGGIAMSLPFNLSRFSWQVFRSWTATLIILNSSINSLIFFWNSSLLRNEAKKVPKNLCKPAN